MRDGDGWDDPEGVDGGRDLGAVGAVTSAFDMERHARRALE